MAVPTYDELVCRHNVDNYMLEVVLGDDQLMKLASSLDHWEILAKHLKIPDSEIENIKSKGDLGWQKIKMLERWKQRCGQTATYKSLLKALLECGRTDLADMVLESFKSTKQRLPSPTETNMATSTLPASSSETEDMSPPAATGCVSPSSLPTIPNEQTAQEVISTLREFEEEFYDLVIYIEDILEKSQVCLNTIIRRFRMLPQSVRRQHQTDENYKEIRKSILNSRTTKELFDNLTELKHWNYMTPDTLTHVIQDIKIVDIHKKIESYKDKLMAFKANTKLRELVGLSFPVPDYCMELTMEVEGWEDKTIVEVENRAVNMVRRAAYGSPHISLGWKGVIPGSVKVTFILMESVKVVLENLLEDNGVVSVQVDGDTIHNKNYTKVNHKLIPIIINLTFPGITGCFW